VHLEVQEHVQLELANIVTYWLSSTANVALG